MWWPFTPDQASTVAGPVDTLYVVLILLSLLFSVPVAFLIVFFGIKYRRGAKANRTYVGKYQSVIETTWIVVPFFLAMGVFGWSASLFYTLSTPPAGALEVYVIGKQWMWKTQHPNGQREINTLHVPVNQPVKLIMTSQDVIHDFYIPAFRVKQDVLPGRYTEMWFEATKTGEFPLHCAEYCGTDHSVMGGSVIVMEQTAYEQWLASGSTQPTLQQGGEQLFASAGCNGCHGLTSTTRAPGLAGLFGQQVQLANGETVIADETYIRNSILNPQQQVVAGYQPIMPSFQGQLNEEQIQQLVEYIKGLQAGSQLSQR